MTTALALTLASAAIGIIAGLWFCVGSVFTPPETLAELATSYWDYHPTHAQVIVEQSAQYSVGAPLLVLAFVLQVVAALLPAQTTALWLSLAMHPLLFLTFSALIAWALSFVAYRLLVRAKGKRVHAILMQRTQSEA